MKKENWQSKPKASQPSVRDVPQLSELSLEELNKVTGGGILLGYDISKLKRPT